MIHKKLLSLLVLLMTVATGAWADIAVGNVFKTGSTIDFGTSSVRYKQFSGSSDNSSMGISGMVTLTYEEYSDGKHKFCFPMGSSVQFMYIVSDNNAEPWDIRVSGGEGTMGNPYSFEVLFEEQVSLSINNNKDEATFTMPASDATVDYELVRDMAIAVNAVMPASIRIQQKQQGGGYKPIDATKMIPEVKDAIDGESQAVTMTEVTEQTAETGDYTLQLQKKVDDEWTSVSPDVLGPGTYRYEVTGANLYDGTTTTNEFQLIEGYPVTVPAHGFVTYYSDEKLTIDDEDAGIYTVQQVTGN